MPWYGTTQSEYLRPTPATDLSRLLDDDDWDIIKPEFDWQRPINAFDVLDAFSNSIASLDMFPNPFEEPRPAADESRTHPTPIEPFTASPNSMAAETGSKSPSQPPPATAAVSQVASVRASPVPDFSTVLRESRVEDLDSIMHSDTASSFSMESSDDDSDSGSDFAPGTSGLKDKRRRNRQLTQTSTKKIKLNGGGQQTVQHAMRDRIDTRSQARLMEASGAIGRSSGDNEPATQSADVRSPPVSGRGSSGRFASPRQSLGQADRPKYFPCPHDGCNQICKSNGDLKRHLESRAHKAPSYICLGCDFPYTRTDALRRHLKARSECARKHRLLAESRPEDGEYELE